MTISVYLFALLAFVSGYGVGYAMGFHAGSSWFEKISRWKAELIKREFEELSSYLSHKAVKPVQPIQ